MRIISSDHFLIHDEEIQKESPVQLTVSWEWENQNQLGEGRGERGGSRAGKERCEGVGW